MTKSTKAALFSAFIIPGAGHFFLQRHLRATILASTSLIALYILISKAIEKALILRDKILSGEVEPHIATIMELVSKQSEGADASLINLATLVLIIVWLVGVIDAYRIGRIQDRNAESHKHPTEMT